MSRQYKTQHKSNITQDLNKVKSREYLLFSLYIDASHFSYYLYKHYIDLSIIVFFLQVSLGSPNSSSPIFFSHEKHL
jgi:hypothetical protein